MGSASLSTVRFTHLNGNSMICDRFIRMCLGALLPSGLILLLALCQCTLPDRRSADCSAEAMSYFDKAQQAAENNDYNEMLHNYYLFLRQAQDAPETCTPQLITAYIDIGNLFVAHSDFTSAKGYYEKGYSLSQSSGNEDAQTRCLLGLCQTSLYTGDTIAARQWNERILELKEVALPNKLHFYYLNRACDFLLQNRLDSAKCYYIKDLQLIEQHDFNQEEKYNSLMSLCKCYTIQSEIDSALHYAHLAYDNAAYGTVSPLRKLFVMSKLGRLYAQKGDTERAAYYQTLSYDLRDSVENLRDFLAIKSEQEQFEEAQSKASIMQLSTSNTRLRNVLLLSVGIALLLAAMVYYVLRQKHRTEMNYRALFERNKELLKIGEEYHQSLVQMQQMQRATTTETEAQSTSPVSQASERDFDEALWQRIVSVLDTVDEVCSPDFGLIRLTSLVESNTTYVSQTIKSATGKNVPTLINDYRIREACRRLLDTGNYGKLTLQAVAESVGFTSQTTFNRAFKQCTGLTPAIYRKLSIQQSDNQILDKKSEL